MQLKAKSIHLSSVVCCYIAAIVGCMFISCECKNGYKKITSPMEEIQVPSDNSEVPPSSSDLTIETKKSILLGKDTLLPVTFLTTNKEIHLEDYTLKITLEDKKDNTSKIGVQGTSGLQNSMEKPLIAFADLINYPAASSGVFKKALIAYSRVSSHTYYPDSVHNELSSSHSHAYLPYLQNTHHSKIPLPITPS